MSARQHPRAFCLTPQQDKATKWVFKRLIVVVHVVVENVETYLPGVTRPKDGLSEEGIGALLCAMCLKLQIGSSEIGWGKDKPCSMCDLAKLAKYSNRHSFRIQVPLIESGYVTSDHKKKGLPAKRELTPKFWAAVKPLLKEHLEEVPKDVKDQEKIEHWIQQLIQKGRDYLAAKARSQARAEEKPLADPAVQAAEMRTIQEIFAKSGILGRGGGDPAPAV